jgi:serine/threonine-protein kinase
MVDDDATRRDPTSTPTVAEGPRRAPAPLRLTGNRYRVGARLGHGGMGEVLDAHDEQIGRDVAIKRILAATPAPGQVERFVREACIQGQLEHPSIVPVHELGRDVDGRPYFAMKKLAGTTLAAILRTQDATFPRQRLLRAFADVCLAVELAHTRGIIHRDLKPDNVMLGDFGETYVLDWGVAKLIGQRDEPERAASIGAFTAAGAAVGTAGFMPPEQARGDTDIDGRADVYALGCVLSRILAHEPARPIPPELEALQVRATQLDRAQRIASARELGDAVQRYLDGDRDLAQRRTIAAQHLETALAAFGSGDRAVAMREAGRALALDPALSTAGDLITRLMLEPPRESPPEVVREVELENANLTRRNARLGAYVYLTYLLFVPVLLAGGVDVRYAIALTVLGVLNAAYMWFVSRAGVPYVRWPTIVLNTVTIVVCARLASPFLLGPAIATVCALGLMTGSFVSRGYAIAVVVAHIAAMLGPWVAERLALVSPTTRIADGTMRLTGALFVSPVTTQIVLVAEAIGVVVIAVVLMRNLRTAERAARERVHLQAWQLRQLVSDRAG